MRTRTEIMQKNVVVLLVLSLALHFVAPAIAASQFRTDDYNYDNSDYMDETPFDAKVDEHSMGQYKSNNDCDDEAGARNKREANPEFYVQVPYKSIEKFATRSEPLPTDDKHQQQPHHEDSKMIDENFLHAYNEFIASRGAPKNDFYVAQQAPNKEQDNPVSFTEKVVDCSRAPTKIEESQETSHSVRRHHNDKIRVKKDMPKKSHVHEYKDVGYTKNEKLIKTRQAPTNIHGNGNLYDSTLLKLNKKFLRSRGAPSQDAGVDLETLLKRLKQPLPESQKPTAIPPVVTLPPIFRKGGTDPKPYSGATAPDWKSEFVVPFEDDDSYDN